MAAFKEFKKALVKMKKAGELEKILNSAFDLEDKKKVEHDIEIINQLSDLGADNVSAIPVIMDLQSVAIFKDALCYMDDSKEA